MKKREPNGNPPDTATPPKPLHADPARQAGPLFKWIAYQVWQTVLAWAELGEDEILVVEGAEDFDRVAPTEAVGNQVKALTKPISLRSDCVVETLRNFWTTKQRNASRAVALRFITTARFAVEAGDPFGASKAGLEVWNEEAARPTPRHSERLREFLVSDASVAQRLGLPFGDGIPSLIDHLRQLTPEAFHSEFVRRVEWLAEQPDVEVVRETVRVTLCAYGSERHLLSGDSELALAPLFEHVVKVAIKQGQILRRSDFADCFDEATRMRVPRSQFNQMQAAIAGSLQPRPGAATEISFTNDDASVVPDLPVPCARRTKLVETLAACVTEHGFLAVQGSTGKGKSTVAKLVAAKLSGTWLWISFSRWEAVRVSEELHRLARQVAASASSPFVLLDDLNPSGADTPMLLKQLAVLARLTRLRGGRLIVTTQRVLGNVFLRQSNVPPAVLQQIPAFHEDEVKELCSSAGCPHDNRLQIWVNIISSQTSRHPQLVHARVKVASRRGWPMPTVTDVLETPQELSDERQLSRQLLQELDESEVALLYRLSLASGPFRRDQAVVVAEISPPILRPADKFDTLVGPWIEPAGGRYFRLSSLLNNAGTENWSPAQAIAIRKEYGRAIMRSGGRTLVEASEVLFQAVMSKDAGLAAPVLASLMLAPVSSRKTCSDALAWMLVLSAPSAIFAENPFVCHLFSLIQFRVAAASDSHSAPKFAEQLIEQSKLPVHREVDTHLRAGPAMDVILAIQVLVAPKLLLECWQEAIRDAEQNEQLGRIARSLETQRPEAEHLLPQQTFAEMLFSFILCRRGGSSYLLELLKAIESLPSGQRETAFAMLKTNSIRLFGFMDDVWTHELTKETPDWNGVISALQEAFDSGRRWGVPALSMIAARGIAAVQDEYLQQRDQALKTLADAATKLGADGLMLRYQRGMIHYLHREFAEAYEAWVSTLDEWPTDSEESALYAFYAFSNCGASAGFMNRWDDAASVFARGREVAKKVRRKLDALKFGIDAAYAMWRANRRQEALAALSQGLFELEELGKTAKSAEFHTQWKLTEHVIRWCAVDAGAPTSLAVVAPRPGICSEAKEKERHDLLKDTPRGSVLLSWYSLAEAELCAGLGRAVFLATVARPDVSEYPAIRPMIEFLRVRRALADGEFESVPVLAESAALSFSGLNIADMDERTLLQTSAPSSQRTQAPLNAQSFVEESLLCALLVMAERDVEWAIVIERWFTEATRLRSSPNFLTVLATIKRIHEGTARDTYAEYASPTATRFSRVVAAIRMAMHPDASPAMRYVGLCSLVTDEGFATNLTLSHGTLASLTRRVWLDCVSHPFELCSPRVTVPAIQAACNAEKTGLALAATILLAANQAVTVRNTATIQGTLQKLAEASLGDHNATPTTPSPLFPRPSGR